jgi:hypothetical protein
MRRGFQYVEWYHIMAELPLYSALLPSRALRHASLAVLLVMSGYLYYRNGIGPLTSKPHLERIETKRGLVYMRPQDASDYWAVLAAIDRIDPSGQRPLFAFGYTGGFNYFFGRKNPTSLTQGFSFSYNPPPEKLPAETIFLYNTHWDVMGVPSTELKPWRWRQDFVTNPFIAHDLPRFQGLVRGCRTAETVQGSLYSRLVFTLYECRPADGSP